jgi:3-dehydroquinate dehydratase-2
MKLLILNGPNLNMLGIREPDIYGNRSFSALEDFIRETCREEDIDCTLFQSNYEGALVEKIQEAYNRYDGIVINPGAYAHYSYAIRDALKAITIPAVEVHISDIGKREEFRHLSVTAPACVAQIRGRGFDGYTMAIDMLIGNRG